LLQSAYRYYITLITLLQNGYYSYITLIISYCFYITLITLLQSAYCLSKTYVLEWNQIFPFHFFRCTGALFFFKPFYFESESLHHHDVDAFKKGGTQAVCRQD